MKVKRLIEFLKQVDQDAFVVINDEIVNDIHIESGRDKKGYMGDFWLPLEKGNRKALRFTKLDELSNGQIISIKF